MDMIKILEGNSIDFKRCQFGILPLGITNDFSIALRWGSKKAFDILIKYN